MSNQELAAIYARTSSGPRQRDNYSIDEQVEAAWDLCDRKGWSVKRIFADVTVSGETTERKKFQEMLASARKEEFSFLVVWKLDRFCRSLADLVNIQRELQSHGVDIVSVTEALDTSSSAGRFAMRNLGSFAELERELISERTRLGLAGLARERRWPNAHPPLGYDLDEAGRLTINPGEANLVVRIYADYVRLESMPELAFNLNMEGVKTKTGTTGAWNARAVRDVLRNDLYRGIYSVAGVREYMGNLRIIEERLFESAREISGRYIDGHSKKPPMPLSRREAKIEKIYCRFGEYLTHLGIGVT